MNLEKELNELNVKIKSIEDFIKEKKEILNEEKRKIKEIKTKINIDNIKEMEELLKKLNENKINEIKLNIPLLLKSEEKLISLIFMSTDENIHYSLICKNTDYFTEIESLLYNKYPEYKNLNKSFIFNGNKIDVTKDLKYNNIQDSDIITLRIYK